MDKFIEASKRERFAFQQLCEKYKLYSEDDNYSISYTPVGGKDTYDALAQHYYPSSIISDRRSILEIKVRIVNHNTLIDSRLTGWFLEEKKLKSLIEAANLDPDKNTIFYINFINDKTIVWNLTLLHKQGHLDKVVKRSMNKATMNSTSEKTIKKVILLKEEWGKTYNYIFDELSYKRHIDLKEELKKKRKEDTKSMRYTINDILFGKNNK